MSGKGDGTQQSGGFVRLLASPRGWPLVVAAVVGGWLLGQIFGAGPLITLLIIVIVVLQVLWYLFTVADRREREAFFSGYASARGLTRYEPGAWLDGTSPLLRKGVRQKTSELLTGPVADGVEGSLALFSYFERTDRDSEVEYQFTIVTARMPGAASKFGDVQVRRKSGLKALEGLEDAFRRKTRRVTLESEAIRDRYEIFIGETQDELLTRQLFSPSFIVWLAEEPPAEFGFEIEDGYFVAYHVGWRRDTDRLDRMRAVSGHIARQIRETARGADPPPGAGA